MADEEKVHSRPGGWRGSGDLVHQPRQEISCLPGVAVFEQAASGEIDLGKHGAGDGGTAEIELGIGHFGKGIAFDLTVRDLAERTSKPPGGIPYAPGDPH